MFSLLRLKSMMRYSFRWPPPWWRTVILPWALRPASVFIETSRAFSAFLPRVRSSKALTDMKRRPGEVGLYFLMGICLDSLEEVLDLLALGQGHDRLLPIRLKTTDTTAPALLAVDVHGVDADHVHLESVRDGQGDLGLGRLRMDAEQVLAGRHGGVTLLTDQGPLDHLDRFLHESQSSPWVNAFRVRTTLSAASTSPTFRLETRMVLTEARLRVDFSSRRSCSGRTKRIRTPACSAVKKLSRVFVFGASSVISSTIRKAPSRTFAERAARRARRRCLRGIFCS